MNPELHQSWLILFTLERFLCPVKLITTAFSFAKTKSCLAQLFPALTFIA